MIRDLFKVPVKLPSYSLLFVYLILLLIDQYEFDLKLRRIRPSYGPSHAVHWVAESPPASRLTMSFKSTEEKRF